MTATMELQLICPLRTSATCRQALTPYRLYEIQWIKSFKGVAHDAFRQFAATKASTARLDVLPEVIAIMAVKVGWRKTGPWVYERPRALLSIVLTISQFQHSNS
jgi:hypothetical protein